MKYATLSIKGHLKFHWIVITSIDRYKERNEKVLTCPGLVLAVKFAPFCIIIILHNYNFVIIAFHNRCYFTEKLKTSTATYRKHIQKHLMHVKRTQ